MSRGVYSPAGFRFTLPLQHLSPGNGEIDLSGIVSLDGNIDSPHGFVQWLAAMVTIRHGGEKVVCSCSCSTGNARNGNSQPHPLRYLGIF